MNNLPNHQFENTIAHYVTYFIRVLHILFSLALMITVILSLIVFFVDIYHIFLNGNLTEGTIHALGSLLLLWTLSELLHSEVRSLKGERIQVSIFIEVAIAAFVRKLLVISTEGATLATAASYLASLLVLGAVYWILHNKNKVKRNPASLN